MYDLVAAATSQYGPAGYQAYPVLDADSLNSAPSSYFQTPTAPSRSPNNNNDGNSYSQAPAATHNVNSYSQPPVSANNGPSRYPARAAQPSSYSAPSQASRPSGQYLPQPAAAIDQELANEDASVYTTAEDEVPQIHKFISVFSAAGKKTFFLKLDLFIQYV